MKTISTLIIFLLISLNLFSQKIEYSIEAGGNYNISTNYINNSTGKLGFHLSNKFTFPLNKHFSLKTGLGLDQLNSNLNHRTAGMVYFSGTNMTTFYNDRQPFIIPNSVIVVYDENGEVIGYEENLNPLILNPDTTNYNYPISSNYNLFLLNIPLQIQINFFKNRLLLTTGFSASTIIYAKNTMKFINGESIEYNANDDFRNVFFNLNIGLDFKIFKNIYAGIYYERSSNIVKSKNQFIDPEATYFGYGTNLSKTNLNNISINLSYKF